MSLAAARSFLQTVIRSRHRDRGSFERWQSNRVDHWLRHSVPGVKAYSAIDPNKGLLALPILDKTQLMARFASYNRLGLDAETALSMADGAAPPPGHFVGASTGTTGPRQPYVITNAERQVWLGTILAKTLGFAAFRRPRVAVVLPRGSALYDAAAKSLPLCFVPIGDGFDAMARRLVAFRPDAIVAPPRALRWLAEQGTSIAPRILYSGAEVMDPMDRQAIRHGFPDARLGEIYMATEGLLAVTCAHGTLHLAEDRVHFELEDAGNGLVSPIISDFSRHTQIMARYRMNDLLRMGPPCPCGSVLRSVAEVQGRCDDVFDLGGVPVTPDILRDAVLAQGGVSDFRVHQTGPTEVTVFLPPGAPDRAAEVTHAVTRAGAQAKVLTRFGPLSPPVDRKLRRVERRWWPN